MSIKMSSCSCCDGYVVACDQCKTESTRCSNDSMEDAVEFAVSAKKFKTVYPTPSSPAEWRCPACQK